MKESQEKTVLEQKMAITPQAIKDQEFQIKFRGYDTVEVKAYLELIAEEFFELLEQVRKQVDELDSIAVERDLLVAEKKSLENDLVASGGASGEIEHAFIESNSEIEALKKEIAELRRTISSLERDLVTKEEHVEEVRSQCDKKVSDYEIEKSRVIKLMNKVDALEKENEGLRREEMDFKSTLIAAQQFSNEMKRKSELEARKIVEKAKRDSEKLRIDTQKELDRYPAEIERLKQRRAKVRDELEAVLRRCTESLEMFGEYEEEDYGDLYLKIVVDENGAERKDNAQKTKHNLDGGDVDIPDDLFSLVDKTEGKNG